MVKKKTPIGSGKTVAKLKEKAAKKQKPAQQPMIKALVWYKEEHYPELLAMFDDAELLLGHGKSDGGFAEQKHIPTDDCARNCRDVQQTDDACQPR